MKKLTWSYAINLFIFVDRTDTSTSIVHTVSKTQKNEAEVIKEKEKGERLQINSMIQFPSLCPRVANTNDLVVILHNVVFFTKASLLRKKQRCGNNGNKM